MTAPYSISPAYCPPNLNLPSVSCQSNGPRISLEWSEVSGDLFAYQILRKTEEETQFSLIATTTAITYNDGPNIEGTQTYIYAIKSVWQNYGSSTSNLVGATAPACPPVLNVSADCLSVEPGGPQNNLSWNNLLGIKEYQVWRLDKDQFIATTAQTFYSDKLVETSPDQYYQDGITYYYKIKTVWSNGTIRESDQKQQGTIRCAPFLKVNSNCLYKEMVLSWTKTKGTTRYNVYKDGGYLDQTIENNFTFGLDDENCPGFICSFQWQVKANEGGLPDTSDLILGSIDCQNPPPPSPEPDLNSPTVDCLGTQPRIKNSWQTSQNISYYKVFRNNESKHDTVETFWIDDGVGATQNYTYWVRAMGPNEYTDSTNEVNVTAPNCYSPSPPPKPTLTRDCESGAPFIEISWEQSSNVINYQILKGITSDNLSVLDTVGPNVFYLKDPNVLPSTDYYYQIKAIAPSGVPPTYSSIVSTTTGSCYPTTPVVYLFNSCNGLNPAVIVNWTTDEINTARYEIFKNGELVETIYFPEVKTWQDDYVSPKTSYQYRVEAVGFLGQRSPSSPVNIITWWCQPPGDFTLNNPSIYCRSAYPWADLSWSSSSNALYFDLNRHLYSGDLIVETTTIVNNLKSSPHIDRGYGRALSFNNNGHIEIGNPPSLNNLNALTIEFWAKPKSTTSFMGVLGTGDSWSAPGFSFYFRGQSSNLNRFRFTVGFADRYKTVEWGTYENGDYEYGRWYHVVGTYRSSDGQLRLYVNGVRRRNTVTGASEAIVNNDILRIGDIPGISRLRGEIDEVRIYNREISLTEVSEHYQGIYNNESGLVGYWHFDEGSGTKVSDSSNYGNNGEITGSFNWIQNGPQVTTKYSWQALAFSNGLIPRYSNVTDSFITPSCPPGKPGLVLTQDCFTAGKSAINLSWSYSINATIFQIWRDLPSPSIIKTINIGDAEFNTRTWLDDNNGLGLSGGTDYTYWIKAIEPGGLFTESDHLTVKAPYCQVPGQPQNLQVASVCSNSFPEMHLSWDAVPLADYYEIFKNNESHAVTSTTSFVDKYPYVKVDKNYSYFIVSHNLFGSGPSSTEKTAYQNYCPVSKSSLSVSSYCFEEKPANEINWKDSTFFNSNEYKIWRNPGNVLVKTLSSPDSYSVRFRGDIISNYGNIECLNINNNSLDITDKLTIEAWVKFDSISTQGFIGKGSNYQLAIGDVGRKLRFLWGGTFLDSTVNHGFAAGIWYHIAVTVDVAAQELKFYASGAQLGTTRTFSSTLPVSTANLILGKGTSAKFVGNLDEVRIYNRVLSAAEIQQHYQKNYSDETKLRGLWHFNEGKGNKARDSSDNANDCNMLPQYGYGADWEILEPSDPTYSITDIKFSSEYKTFTDDDSNLQSNANYSYWIETTGHTGPATSSETKGVSTLDCSFIPLPPNITNLETGCYGKDPYTSLTWQNSLNAFSYNVYRSTTSNPLTFYTKKSPFTDWSSFALYFDGTQIKNARIPLNSLGGLSAASIEFWLYIPSSGPGDHNILKDNWFTFHSFPSATFHLTAQPWSCGQSYCPSGYLNHSKTLSKDAWHHFVGTYDMNQIGNNMKLYLDGELMKEQEFPYGPLAAAFSNLLINDGWQSYGPLNGYLDELRIYDRALTGYEIFERFNYGIYRNETGLRGYWSFDSGTGNQILDSSPYNNHGTIDLGDGVFWFKPISDPLVFDEKIHRPDLKERENYKYQVTALGVGTESDFSSQWNITTPACSPFIENFIVESSCFLDNGLLKPQFYLQWESNAEYFQIFRRLEGEEEWLSIDYTTDHYFYNTSGFENTPGLVYEFYVKGTISGEDAISEIASSSVPNCISGLQKPEITNIQPLCSGLLSRMKIEWGPQNNPYAVKYEIWRKQEQCEGAGNFELFKGNLHSLLRFYIDTEVLDNEDYCYKIRAIDENEAFLDSDPLGNRTKDCFNSPPSPLPVLEFDVLSPYADNLWLQIKWEDVEGETEYRVYRDSILLATTSPKDAESGPTKSYYKDDNIEDDITYIYQVSAFNKNGEVFSSELIVPVPIAIPGSFILSGELVEEGSRAYLWWTAPATTTAGGRAEFILQRNETENFETTEVCSTFSLSCYDESPSSLAPFYRVTARNLGGSNDSNIVNLSYFLSTEFKWKEVQPD